MRVQFAFLKTLNMTFMSRFLAVFLSHIFKEPEFVNSAVEIRINYNMN